MQNSALPDYLFSKTPHKITAQQGRDHSLTFSRFDIDPVLHAIKHRKNRKLMTI